MTIGQLLEFTRKRVEEYKSAIPAEHRHEVNIVEQQVKQAVKNMDAVKLAEIQAKYGVYKSPFEK